MTKRLIAFAIVLAMVASFVPLYAVAAEETVKASPKAGTHTSAAHKCEECGSTDWKTLLVCFLQYLPAGIALAGAYEVSGTIIVPMLMHITINLIAIVAMR